MVATTAVLPSVAARTGSNTVPAATAARVRPARTPSIVSHAGNGRIRSCISSASAAYSSTYMAR